MLRLLAARPISPVLAAPRLRGLSSMLPAAAMSLEQALTSNHLILSELESPAAKQQLNAVRDNAPDVLTKWQQTNAVLVHATLRALPQLGYSADGNGLQQYSQAFAECVRGAGEKNEAGTLRQLNASKWRVLLREGFGCEPPEPVDIARARVLAIAMVDALQDEALLRQVDESRTGLAARLSENERQHMVARAVVSVQVEVTAKHGYPGDAGFAQAQVAMMEHANDAVVTASVAAATTNLYARAGIDLQDALRQAAGGGS